MKNIKYILLLFTLIYVGCGEKQDLPLELLEQMNSGNAVSNERIEIVNLPIELRSNNQNAESMASFSAASGVAPSFNCDESITSNFSGNTRVNNRTVVCLNEGVSLSGTVELKGGTLVIKGNASLSGINGNKGKIVITETGSLTIATLNINNNFDIENYSNDLTLDNINISGDFENHGNITVGSVTINGGGDFKNTGEMIIENHFNNNNDVVNEGKLTVEGNLTINGGAEFDNHCQLAVKGNLQNNKTLKNRSYVSVDGTLTINGGAKVQFDPQAYLKAEHLTMNGSIEGSSRGYARVDIADRTLINGGGRVKKKIDFNDANGIETNRGRFEREVTTDQAIDITITNCNPGPFVTPLNPEYTLVANITVPQINNNNLSATDVYYDNGLAFISYHLNGPSFGGAIDFLDISSINAPQFTMNYLNEAREFNAILRSGNKVYLAGQRDIDESGYNSNSNSTQGAVLFVADLLRSNILDSSESWTEIPMPSFSGNSVDLLSNNKAQFASGASGGGFFEVNPSSSRITKSEFRDYAKYVTSNDQFKLKLIGGQSTSKLLVEKNGQSNEVDLGLSANPVDGKNVVTIYENMAYAALGSNGLVVVDLESFEVVNAYNPDKPGLTNGVAVDNDFIYLANGQSGLLLLRRSNLEFYGQYKYDGSANLVEVTENIILIANGTGGIKLLVRTS